MYLSNGISVIIPTYNRSLLLKATLKSLSLQSCGNDFFEVIIINDGSTDDTSSVVSSFESSLNIKYLTQEHLGFRVARARNLGIAAARFNTCLFFDSGMLASPELIDIHINAHSQSKEPIALVGYADGFEEFSESIFSGPVDFDTKEELDEIFKKTLAEEEYSDCRKVGLKKLDIDFDELKIPWLLFWTCHASCSTSALRSLSGFDENFQSWGGEDVELAIRLHQAGITINHLPKARAFHLPHSRSTAENKMSAHLNCKYIFKKHPSIETELLIKNNQSWEAIISEIHS